MQEELARLEYDKDKNQYYSSAALSLFGVLRAQNGNGAAGMGDFVEHRRKVHPFPPFNKVGEKNKDGKGRDGEKGECFCSLFLY